MPLETVLNFFVGYVRTAAVKSGVELDIFTAIGEGADTASLLAARCHASERGVRMLCDYLTATGLLQKHQDKYRLGVDASRFLDRRSPSCIGSAVISIAGENQLRAFARLTAAVRQGGTALDDEGVLAPEHPVWVEFARAMVPSGKLLAPMLANHPDVRSAGGKKVLDIAAGHGLYGIAIAALNPETEVFAVDWPNVLVVAREQAVAAGVASRHHSIVGSALTVDFGTDYDLALLVHFLQDLAPADCQKLLAKVHGALAPGGRAVVLGSIPNDDRVSPPAHAEFALTMLATTPGGDAYTVTELDAMFRHAGFAWTKMSELTPRGERVMIAYRS